MIRQVISGTIGLVAMFGLTACASGQPGTTAPTSPAPATSAPAATETEQTVRAACMELAEPISEANQKLAEIMSLDTSNPQNAVDAWSTLVDAFAEFQDSVSNPEVKAAATAVHADVAAVRDALEKVYIQEDLSAMNEFTQATTNMQTSYTALTTLCAS